MQRTIGTFLSWTLILCACSARGSTPPPLPTVTTQAESPTVIAITAVPTDLPPCGYQWAYQDLPELSRSFQQSIQALQPEAHASAFAFGENCIGPDGTTVVKFLPMETDFNITLQVSDLTDASDLGEWTVRVMQVIEDIPPEQIVGPRAGRVTLGFQSNAEQRVVSFYVNQYQELPAGLSNAEIFQALQSPQ